MHRQVGVSLLEVMITVSIMTVLLGIGVPSFTQFIADARLVASTNELIAALASARSEAISRGSRVTLCKTDSPNSSTPLCNSAVEWNMGWLLFVDNTQVPGNILGMPDGSDVVIRAYSHIVGVDINGGLNYFRGISYLDNGASQGIKADGSQGLANGKFRICTDNEGREIIINNTGRARIKKITC